MLRVLIIILMFSLTSISQAAQVVLTSPVSLTDLNGNITELYGKLVTTATLGGTTLTLTLADDSTITVNLAGLQDGTGVSQLDDLTDVTGDGTTDYMLYDDGDGTYSFREAPSGSMVYPGAGIPLSTGSAWGTSYTITTLKNALDDETWTFANGITAPLFTSSAADGARFFSSSNTVALTSTATLGRIAWLTDRWWLANGTNWTTRYLLDSSFIGSAVQAYDADLADLADGSLTASKVGNGYYVADDCTTVSSPATGAICDEY